MASAKVSHLKLSEVGWANNIIFEKDALSDGFGFHFNYMWG